MQWLNPPAKSTSSPASLTVLTAPGGDFWRTTHYGFIRHSGHFLYHTLQGNFTAAVKITGRYRDLYDQAGLMLRLDEHNWIKTGIEYVHGVQQASAVVTRDFSDWNVSPLSANPASLWLKLQRTTEAVEISYALDGSTYTLLRLAYFPTENPVQVGVMCCSPDGGGFEVDFEEWTLES